MRDSLATPLPVDGQRLISLVPRPRTKLTPHMRNGTERRNEEASLCNNGLIFILCGGIRNYDGIKTAAVGEKQARWIQHC